MAVVFTLLILVLLGWFVRLVWPQPLQRRQKGRERKHTPAVPDAAAELEC